MKPGATIRPLASMTRRAVSGMGEISAILPPRMPMWRTPSKLEGGSTICALMTTRSNGCASSGAASRNRRTRLMNGLYILTGCDLGQKAETERGELERGAEKEYAGGGQWAH